MPHDPASRNGGVRSVTPVLATMVTVWMLTPPAAQPVSAPLMMTMASATSARTVGFVREQPRARLSGTFGFAVGQERHGTAGAFGFRVGEERRYAYYPADYLEPGEIELWTISLESIALDDSGRWTADFDLSFESKRFIRRGNIFNPDEMRHLVRTTRLRVNQHGFPLEIDVSLQQRGIAWQGERVHFRYVDGRFQVSDPQSMSYRRFNISPPAAVDTDRETPYGVFVAADTNPGLLALPYHAAERDRARADYFELILDVRSGRTFPNRSRSSFDARTMTFHDTKRILVGQFTTTARRVRVDSRDWWIAQDGKVLLRPVSRRRIKALRLVWPSEYW